MTRKDAIIARRSVRTYTEEPIKDKQLLDLRRFIGTLHPLHASIKININILSRADFQKNYRTTFAANASHYLVIRSVKKDGWLENAGFITKFFGKKYSEYTQIRHVIVGEGVNE